MNHIRPYLKHVCAVLLGVWMGLSAILPSFCAALSCGDGTEGETVPRIGVRWEGSEAWVYASPDLLLLAEGQPMALLLYLEIPENASVLSCKAGEETVGLRLTVGERGRDSLKILMDGVFETTGAPREDTLLLRILFERKEEALKIGSETVFCFVGKDGGVQTVIPRIAAHEEEPTSEPAEETDPSDGESESCLRPPHTSETKEDPQTPGETRGNEETDGTEEPPLPLHMDRFMGCRETRGENGSFTVQLLFYGESGVTPVIGRREDGWLLPDVIRVSEEELSEKGDISMRGAPDRADGGFWSLCTFFALSCEESYLFAVYTSEKTVYVRYERGNFRGFHTQNE